MEHLCWEAGGTAVRAKEGVETARSAVNHLVFSRSNENRQIFRRRLQFA